MHVESIYFTEQHERLRVRVRDFLARDILPFAADWEAQRRLPRHVWKSFGEQGLLGLNHPREAGGGDCDLFSSVVFLEELGRTGFGGLRAAVSVHAYMATYYIARSGGAMLRQRYLVPAVAGDQIAALGRLLPGPRPGRRAVRGFGPAEPGRFFAVRGRCRQPWDHDPPHRADGLARRGSGDGVLRRCAGATKLGRAVGRPNSGFYQLMRGFQLERVVAAVLALGGADRSLRVTREHLVRRRAFGARLADLQAVRHRVADLATELAAARQLVYHAVWRYQSDDMGSVRECSMAKLYATELASRVADLSLQLHGAHGYLDDTEVARTFRDARAATIAAGPSEVMRDIIARLEIDEATSP